MNDRGMIKWRPFNSVVPSKELLRKDVQIDKPSLSSDEVSDLEEKVKNSFYTQSIITITYFYDNKVFKTSAYVTKIDSIKKNIYLSNSKIINFRQIYEIK